MSDSFYPWYTAAAEQMSELINGGDQIDLEVFGGGFVNPKADFQMWSPLDEPYHF